MGVLGQSPVTDMSKAKNPFHDVKGMFDLRPYLGLDAVARPLGLTQGVAAHRFLLDELPGLGGGFPNDLPLSLVGRIPPNLPFFPVQ